MSTPKKPDGADELDRFEEALVDSILTASETELREDIRAAGDDPDAIISGVDALLLSAKRTCATQRLREAKENVRAIHADLTRPSAAERAAAQVRLDAARAGDRNLSSKTLLAARNGQGATDRDIASLLDDLAELARLEQEVGENNTDDC